MENSHPLFKRRLTYFAITAFFLVVTVLSVLFFMFNVRIYNVNVENCQYSDKAAVLAAADIKTGTHSYAIDKEKISASIMEQNPYVTDVRIKRTGINTLTVILTEDAPRFYIKRGDSYLILSETLRVLASYSSTEEYAHLAVYPINLIPIESAEIGKTLVFAEDYEDRGEECISLLSQISSCELSGTITFADVSERFDIRLTYKDKYEIRFGSPKNFGDKLSLVIETIEFLEDPANGYSKAKGIIRASVDGETSFEPTGAVE